MTEYVTVANRSVAAFRNVFHYIRSFRADNTRAVCARHDGLQRSVGRRHHTYRYHIEVLSSLVKAKLFLTAREHHRNDAQR